MESEDGEEDVMNMEDMMTMLEDEDDEESVEDDEEDVNLDEEEEDVEMESEKEDTPPPPPPARPGKRPAANNKNVSLFYFLSKYMKPIF